MTNPSVTDRTCSNLPKRYFDMLGDQLSCVSCDGSVNGNGVVTPRASIIAPPVARNTGARIERLLSTRITLRGRSALRH